MPSGQGSGDEGLGAPWEAVVSAFGGGEPRYGRIVVVAAAIVDI